MSARFLLVGGDTDTRGGAAAAALAGGSLVTSCVDLGGVFPTSNELGCFLVLSLGDDKLSLERLVIVPSLRSSLPRAGRFLGPLFRRGHTRIRRDRRSMHG